MNGSEHFPVLSSFMTYHRVCYYINTTGATSGSGTTYPSGAPEFIPVFSGVRVTRSLLLTPLISSNLFLYDNKQYNTMQKEFEDMKGVTRIPKLKCN
jgi:hypothetical protein